MLKERDERGGYIVPLRGGPMSQTLDVDRLRELARRLQGAEHDRIMRHMQVQQADTHGSHWPGPISSAFEDCRHPDCVFVRAEVERLRAAHVPAPQGELPAPDSQPMADAAEMLWVVLANVSGGDWTKQSKDWQEYAARWRDNYFAAVKAASVPAAPPAPTAEPIVRWLKQAREFLAEPDEQAEIDVLIQSLSAAPPERVSEGKE